MLTLSHLIDGLTLNQLKIFETHEIQMICSVKAANLQESCRPPFIKQLVENKSHSFVVVVGRASPHVSARITGLD
jgi:hypothetical protein